MEWAFQSTMDSSTRSAHIIAMYLSTKLDTILFICIYASTLSAERENKDKLSKAM